MNDDLFKNPTDDANTIEKMLSEIETAQKSLSSGVKVCAVSCILHALKHGNATPAKNLCGILKQEWRAEKLESFFRLYGPITVDKDGNWGVDRKKKDTLLEDQTADADEFQVLLLEKAEKIWNAKASEAGERKFDFGAKLKKLIAKADEVLSPEDRKKEGVEHYRQLLGTTHRFTKKGSSILRIKVEPDAPQFVGPFIVWLGQDNQNQGQQPQALPRLN